MINKVIGKVLLQETGVGIPDLLVEVYDVDPTTKPEEFFDLSGDTPSFAASNPNPWQRFPADRLGCVPTDENGKFELTYEDGDFQIRNSEEKRPDLMVLVTAPEMLKTSPCPQIIHVSCGIRQNAGRTENYIIKLTADRLKAAGITIPRSPVQEIQNPEILVGTLDEAIKRQAKIQEGVKEIRSQRVIEERQRVRALEKNFQVFVDAISTVPADRYEDLNYVRPDESVEAINQKVIAQTIQNKINNPENRSPIVGRLLLNEQQKAALKPYESSDGKFVNVPREIIKPILFGASQKQQQSSFLLWENPLAQICRKKIEEQKYAEACLDLGREPDNNGNNTENTNDNHSIGSENLNVAGNGIEPATLEDIPKYIAKFMEKTAAPEEPVAFWVTGRATQADVQQAVNQFELKGGPADAVSYYDFHNLQIAFEHVWQEAIDRGILDTGMDLYEQVVDLGGDPQAGIRRGQHPVDVLRAEVINVVNSERFLADSNSLPSIQAKASRSQLRQGENVRDHRGESIRDHRGENVRDHRGENVRDHRGENALDLLDRLNQRLKEDYAFTIYAANRQQRSVNFGTLVTYRQEWKPTSYQAGELVKTIPLSPKEVRKFSKKTVVKKRRSEKEVNNNLMTRKEDTSETSRAEQEIMSKAESKTNFNLSASGSFSAGIEGVGSSSGTQTAAVGGDASKNSQEVKKDFREAVFKAAQEYKQERTVEINTEESDEFEFQESGEISNPNDELAVTFLFYELQRRYQVSEKIHRLTPVVLVAQEVPNPADIDEDWLIAHDWILKRVILDDSFLSALMYVSTRLVGDEVALVELQTTIDQQRRVVESLKEELGALRRQVGYRYVALEKAIDKQAGIVGDEPTLLETATDLLIPGGVVEKIGDMFGFGGDDDAGKKEAARIRREAAESAYERAVREDRDLRGRLDRQVSTLSAATETYAKNLSEHLNRKTQVARLKLHIKQNILYYMQAIWSHEPPDQRFFRLHKVRVPVLKGEETYTINTTPSQNNLMFFKLENIGIDTTTIHDFEIDPKIFIDPATPDNFETASLIEVADLDKLLGFKGNYAIFPLKQSNALTDFMMAPYVNNALNALIDPDDLGNWTLEDFAKYVCCLKKTLPPEQFNDELKDQLRQQYQRLLSSPLRNSEEIIVPSGSLFIEALPGKHPILEDFKLMHRAIDVKKVQAEVRKMEMENLRMAARLLTEEYEDPDIDRKIVIEGNGQPVTVSSGNE
jgi:hypothetical protein